MSEIDAVVRCILEAEQSSNDGKEVTPVPMPNTEVKLFSANGSWGLSPCESRTLLDFKWRISSAGRASALQAEGRRFDPVILHHLNMPV